MNYSSFKGRWISTIFALLMIPGALHSNDGIGRIDMNGVHYEKTDDISMDKELLVITPHKIKVKYLFTNHSDQLMKTTVLFPIPLNQKNDPSRDLEDRKRVDPLYRWYARIAGATSHDPEEQNLWSNSGMGSSLSFKVYHDQGSNPDKRWPKIRHQYAKKANLVVRALDGEGRDITEALKEMNVPVSAAFVNTLMENKKGRWQDMATILKDKQWLQVDADGKHTVLWTNTIHYSWDETFPANEHVSVEHSYHTRSVAGASLDPSPFDIKGLHLIQDSPETLLLENKAEFKGHDSIKNDPKAVKDWKKFTTTYRHYASDVSYVLSTGKGWKGGVIKDFTLRIKPMKSKDQDTSGGAWDMATNFPHPFHKQKDGSYECRIKNFTPTDEPLRVMWLQKHPKD